MSTENENINNDDQEINEATSDTTEEDETVNSASSEEEDVDPIEAKIQERLAQMKSNMDRMASDRDAALKKAAELEQNQKKEKMKRLEEEGKVQEVLEMQLAEATAKLKVFEEENVKLNRDQIVNSALATLDFRNDRSRQMAYRDVVEQLSQDDDGKWVHKGGMSINDYIVAYSKDEDNSFLFRTKVNSGAGKSNPSAASPTDREKSILEMSSSELLDAAKKGKLNKFSY